MKLNTLKVETSVPVIVPMSSKVRVSWLDIIAAFCPLPHPAQQTS